jgi:predicted metal-binding protein
MEKSFIVKTPIRTIEIEVYSGFVSKKEIVVDKQCFLELCKKCRNYGKKYACPPKSPNFSDICSREGLFVVMFKCNLEQIKNTS